MRRWWVAGVIIGTALGLGWWLVAKAWKALALVVLVVVVTS